MLCLRTFNMINCFVKPLNIRLSSQFNRRSNNMGVELIRETLDRNRQPTNKEWSELRDELMNITRSNKSSLNIDAIILGNCKPAELDVGKSYVKYLKESGIEPKTSVLINLLKLYYKASKIGIEITKSDQQNIIGMHNDLVQEFPVFDSMLGEGLIYGLVLTADWHKSLEILDAMKILSTPSSTVYSAVIQRAIQEEDEQLVWNLFGEMIAKCAILQSEVFVSYIALCTKNSKTFAENINKMLMFIEENEILVSTKVANEFQRAFQKFGYNCSTTAVTKHGKCQSCSKQLRSVYATDDEFNELSNHFLDKILIGSSIFSKTTPQELESFLTFVDRTKPYDCVIDGLNVAHSKNSTNPLVQANSLASVVKYFVDRKLTVCVLGRKHMTKWPKYQMNYIRENSHLFLTDNLSQDDPFFLYATLKSGPSTDFVTRDLIRDHAFKLDKNLKTIFRRWQQQHQYMVQWIGDNGRITFDEPIKFDMNAHRVDDCWHIPFENEMHCTFKRKSFELRQNWLCVSNVEKL